MRKLILTALAALTAYFCTRIPFESDAGTSAVEHLTAESERAMALYEHGRLEEAREAFMIERRECAQLLGPRDPATLKIWSNLATVLLALGDMATAETANRVVLGLREEELGRLHPDTIASRQNLAVTLLREGKVQEAFQQARYVECVRRHTLGRKNLQYREALQLKNFIEGAMKGGGLRSSRESAVGAA